MNIDNSSHGLPVWVVFGAAIINEGYNQFAEVLNAYDLGLDVMIKTGTAILVVIKLYIEVKKIIKNRKNEKQE